MIIPFLTIHEKNDKSGDGGWQKSINQYLFWAISGLIFAIFTIAIGNQWRFEKLIDTVGQLCAKVAAIEGKNEEANVRQDRRLEVIRQDVTKLSDRVLAIEQHRSPEYRWQGND
jgi:hypothetical protein